MLTIVSVSASELEMEMENAGEYNLKPYWLFDGRKLNK